MITNFSLVNSPSCVLPILIRVIYRWLFVLSISTSLISSLKKKRSLSYRISTFAYLSYKWHKFIDYIMKLSTFLCVIYKLYTNWLQVISSCSSCSQTFVCFSWSYVFAIKSSLLIALLTNFIDLSNFFYRNYKPQRYGFFFFLVILLFCQS